jgi:hypothetical protein
MLDMQVILVDLQPVSADGSGREVPVCRGVICVCGGPGTRPVIKTVITSAPTSIFSGSDVGDH